MRVFASFNRGQPPARHTKVVDYNLCPLKSGSTCLYVPVCVHDAVCPQSLLLWEGMQLIYIHRLLVVVWLVSVVLHVVRHVSIFLRVVLLSAM